MFTTQGLELFAAWEINPSLKKPIKYVAIGTLTDAEYANENLHTGSETALTDQRYPITGLTSNVNRIYTGASDTIAVVEAAVDVPASGWKMREVGLFVDSATAGDDPILVWISKTPEVYIPDNYQALVAGMLLTIPIQFSSADQVQLVTTNDTLATVEVMFQQLLGQAAITGIREMESSQEIGRLKDYVLNRS